MEKAAGKYWGRDHSPTRLSNYRENNGTFTEDDIQIYERELKELFHLVKSNQNLLEKLEDTCLELDVIVRRHVLLSEPITLYWKKVDWKSCPAIKAVLVSAVEIDTLRHLNPNFGIVKVNEIRNKQLLLKNTLNGLYDLYLKFFFPNGEVDFYPHLVDVGFPFPFEDGGKTAPFKVSMIHPQCLQTNDTGQPAYRLTHLVEAALKFVIQLTAMHTLEWGAPKSTIRRLQGPAIPGGAWNLQNFILLGSEGQKFMYGGYYGREGGVTTELEGKYFKLPLSLNRADYLDEEPGFEATRGPSVHPLVRFESGASLSE